MGLKRPTSGTKLGRDPDAMGFNASLSPNYDMNRSRKSENKQKKKGSMTHAKLKLRFGLNEGGSGVAKLRTRAAFSDSVRPSVPCQRMCGPSCIMHHASFDKELSFDPPALPLAVDVK